jgi:hypothetical protein
VDALTRFLELARAEGAWDGVPAIYRPLIVAAVRRDPTRATQRLDQLSAMWSRAKEDSTDGR